MNPMREFIHGDDKHIDDMFHKFKRTHAKRYADDTEHERRKHAFRHNIRYINSKNRQGLSYRLAVNHMADMNGIELKRMRGYINSRKSNSAQSFGVNDRKLRYVPESFDWRLYGAIGHPNKLFISDPTLKLSLFVACFCRRCNASKRPSCVWFLLEFWNDWHY